MQRVVTIPSVVVLSALAWSLAPFALPIAWLVDLARFLIARRPFMASRLYAFVCVYLANEVLGLSLLSTQWIVAGFGAGRAERITRWTYAAQRLWAGVLFASTQRLLGLRYECEGDDRASPGPLLVFIQHASTLDTLVPTTFVTARHGVRLRFVLKKELLVSPCLDVAGHRIPNVFVDRSGARTEHELARIEALARGLAENEGALIYPEGTRFTPDKRVRALEKIAASDPALHERARGLRHLLPPRLGGPLALLRGAPSADCLFIAHHGLEGFEKITDFWNGGLVRGRVRIRMWRVPRSEVPTTDDARTAWLYAQWQQADDWLESEGA